MTNPTFDNNYHATIKLNNIGVSLIERRCLSAATKVMTEALRVLQSALVGHHTGPNELEHLVYRSSLYLHCDSCEQDDSSSSSYSLEDSIHMEELTGLWLDVPHCETLQAEHQEHDLWLQDDEDHSHSNTSSSCDDSFCILNQYGEHMAVGNMPSLAKTKPIFYILSSRIQLQDDEASSASSAETTLALMLHNQGQIFRSLANNNNISSEQPALVPPAHTRNALLAGASTVFALSRLVLQELKTPIAPMVAVALHQTHVECHLLHRSSSSQSTTAQKSQERADRIPRPPLSMRGGPGAMNRTEELTHAKAA